MERALWVGVMGFLIPLVLGISSRTCLRLRPHAHHFLQPVHRDHRVAGKRQDFDGPWKTANRYRRENHCGRRHERRGCLIGLHFIIGAFFGAMILGHESIGRANYDAVKKIASTITMGFLVRYSLPA